MIQHMTIYEQTVHAYSIKKNLRQLVLPNLGALLLSERRYESSANIDKYSSYFILSHN